MILGYMVIYMRDRVGSRINKEYTDKTDMYYLVNILECHVQIFIIQH